MVTHRRFVSMRTGCLLLVFASILLCWASAARAQLLRWEGEFSGLLDLSTSDQPTPLSVQWAYEIDERDIQQVSPGSSVSTSLGPPTAFEMSPEGWGSSRFTADRVDLKITTFTGSTRAISAQFGWNGLVTASNQDDFFAIYRNSRLDRISYSEADLPGIPEATDISGSMRRVELEPYVMGEFSGRFPDDPGLGEFSGRWAIDLENLQLPPNTITYKPLRYLNITNNFPGSESFDRDNTRAWVVTDGQGDLRRLLIGFDRPNGIRNTENDFWVEYDVSDGLAVASDVVGSPEIKASSAEAFIRTLALENTTGSLTVVPEPGSMLILAGAGALALVRRRA